MLYHIEDRKTGEQAGIPKTHVVSALRELTDFGKYTIRDANGKRVAPGLMVDEFIEMLNYSDADRLDIIQHLIDKLPGESYKMLNLTDKG